MGHGVLCKYDFDALTEFNAKVKLEQEQADLLAQQKQFEEIDEMEEDEYEKLSDEQKEEVERKRLAFKRERMQKKKEQKFKLDQERREKEEMEARLAEEEKKQKGRRTTVSGRKGEGKDKKSNEKLTTGK